jgi:proteasome lid subunit RPN8/RPN11
VPDKPDRPDVAQLAKRELRDGTFPARGKKTFRVYFDRKIHERMAAHAAEKLSVEICGILVGDWYKDDNGPYLLVDEAIRADKAQSNTGDVKLTHDDWTDINRQMDTKFTDRKIVGWYHSHPNFGIFLSQYDIFVHQYTFNSPGQIAYVVDPVTGLEGVFCWRDGEVKLLPSFWVGDEVHLSSENKERQPSSAPTAAERAALAVKPEPPPPAASSTLTLILAAACTLLLGYLIGGMRSSAEQLRTEIGAVAQYGLFKCLKPGMHEELNVVQANLATIAQAVDQLSQDHVKLAGDKGEEKKKQWVEVLQALLITARGVQKIDSVYSLTPEETKKVQELINEKEAETANVSLPSSGTGAKPSGSQSPPKPSGSPAAPKPTGEKSTAAPPAAKH